MKNIVPRYISLRTNRDFLQGFTLSRNFNYYDINIEKNLLEYSISKRDIIVPKEFDFKTSRYTVLNDIWYYNLEFAGIHLRMSYDKLNKEFSYNSFYSLLPYRINLTHTIGEHLSDIIQLDLFLKKIIVLNGIAYRKGTEIFIFLSPSQNGKTSFLKKQLEANEIDEIISDDYVLIDLNNRTIVGTPLISLTSNNIQNISVNPIPLHNINLIINKVSTNSLKKEFSIEDFVPLLQQKFQSNLLIEGMIFYYELRKPILKIYKELYDLDIYTVKTINNYLFL